MCAGAQRLSRVPAAIPIPVDLKALNRAAQLREHLHQQLRCLLGIAGAPGCALRRLGDVGNIAGDLPAAARQRMLAMLGDWDYLRHRV